MIIFQVHATGNTAQLDFCGRYELSHLPPNTLILSVRPGNHFEVMYLEKMVNIRTISVNFDQLSSPCNGQHCSVGLLGEIRIESCSPTTLMLSVRPGNHFEVIYLEKMVRARAISVHLIILEVHATDNNAQLGFCGGYRLH